MAEHEKVIVDDRAWIGWNKLPIGVRARIIDKLAALAEEAPEHWTFPEVERWWSDDDLFALHVWVDAEELLVFFYRDGQRIHVDSMLLKEFIDRYGRKNQPQGQSHEGVPQSPV